MQGFLDSMGKSMQLKEQMKKLCKAYQTKLEKFDRELQYNNKEQYDIEKIIATLEDDVYFVKEKKRMLKDLLISAGTSFLLGLLVMVGFLLFIFHFGTQLIILILLVGPATVFCFLITLFFIDNAIDVHLYFNRGEYRKDLDEYKNKKQDLEEQRKMIERQKEEILSKYEQLQGEYKKIEQNLGNYDIILERFTAEKAILNLKDSFGRIRK